MLLFSVCFVVVCCRWFVLFVSVFGRACFLEGLTIIVFVCFLFLEVCIYAVCLRLCFSSPYLCFALLYVSGLCCFVFVAVLCMWYD